MGSLDDSPLAKYKHQNRLKHGLQNLMGITPVEDEASSASKSFRGAI